eukprot:TRINITY_DN5195_c0_g3_i1.p1 TRINITY_DN5195_c0_g3~~TRINITY_DN5195_c0_g3_i1.p1  ORF type:complete len:353 (+),score=127.53 TRINITY_DN5195_c0_g3_i1:46-1104(+)
MQQVQQQQTILNTKKNFSFNKLINNKYFIITTLIICFLIGIFFNLDLKSIEILNNYNSSNNEEMNQNSNFLMRKNSLQPVTLFDNNYINNKIKLLDISKLNTKPFVIFSQQHSATHWLANAIDFHPLYRDLIEGEVFVHNSEFVTSINPLRIHSRNSFIPFISVSSCDYVANKIWSKGGGFILQYNQSFKFGLLDCLEKLNITIIHLHRDHVNRSISIMLREKCAQKGNCNEEKDWFMQLDTNRFISLLSDSLFDFQYYDLQLKAIAERINGSLLTISTESLQNSQTICQIYQFLGVNCIQFDYNYPNLKTHQEDYHFQRPVKDYVLNYHQLISSAIQAGPPLRQYLTARDS